MIEEMNNSTSNFQEKRSKIEKNDFTKDIFQKF